MGQQQYSSWQLRSQLGAMESAALDTRAIGRCPDFDGTDGLWVTWRFRFETWVALTNLNLSIDEWMAAAASHGGPVDNDTMDDNQKKFSVVLFASLVGCVRGRGLVFARRVRRGHGFV